MNLEQEFLEWHNAVVTALNTSVRFLAALGIFGCSKVANVLAEVRKTWRNPREVTPDTLRLPAINRKTSCCPSLERTAEIGRSGTWKRRN
jgi:hypothetical protein